MNGKRARNIRRLTGLKKDAKPDYRVLKEVEKIVYFPDPTGDLKAKQVKRTSILNLAKYQYRDAKKKLKGLVVPNLDKRKNAVIRTEVENND